MIQRITVVAGGVLLFWAASCHAAWPDATDAPSGSMDVSNYLLNGHGFLPVPTFITEPAVGYGIGLTALFFDDTPARQSNAAEGKTPSPNITGVGAAATSNGTWAAGVFHSHSWNDDAIRYMGGFARTNLKTDYYGAAEVARSYQLNGNFLVQQVLFRVADTPWYAGPRFTWFKARINFTGAAASELGDVGKDITIGKAGLVLDYDTRDNIFLPLSGSYAEAEAQYARPGLGSSQSFDTYNLRGFNWRTLAGAWVLGLRADAQFTEGSVPFYAQPFVTQRGVARGRYQDKNAVMAEAEVRWLATPKWSVLGFMGAGRAWGKWHDWQDAATPVGVGTGFRYVLAQKLGLGVGIDIAHSKDQNAWYIQVGSAWH